MHDTKAVFLSILFTIWSISRLRIKLKHDLHKANIPSFFSWHKNRQKSAVDKDLGIVILALPGLGGADCNSSFLGSND